MTKRPASWAIVKIPELLELNDNGKPFTQGWSPQCDAQPAKDNQWGVLKTTAVQSGEFLDSENKRLPDDLDPKTNLEVHAGDIVMTCAGPRSRCGIACLVRNTRPKLLISGKMYKFNGRQPLVDSKYLEAFLLSKEATDDIDKMKTGISDSGLNLTQGRFAELRVPLAPLNEQYRIVAKLEELFSELDKGIENLNKAWTQLEAYRQSVLKDAFEGKVSAQWREERNNMETPDEVLTQVRAARDALYKERLAEWKQAAADWEAEGKQGKKPPKPRKPKELSALNMDDMRDLPELPSDWCWERLGWMTCGVEYGTAAKSAQSGDTPVLRMGNIQNAKLDWTDLVYTSDPAEIAKYSLRPGDVLFNRTNSPELVGKSAIYGGDHPALFAGYLIRVNQIDSVIDGQYLNLFLNSHVARQHGNRVKTDGVNQSNINGEKLQHYPFPYCSLDEQREVVRLLEGNLSVIDRMTTEIREQLAFSNVLRRSILQRAFLGQLVEQNPNDEPAASLLERIQAETEEQSKAGHAKKMPRKRAKKKAKRKKDAA